MEQAQGWRHTAAASCLTFSEPDGGLGSCAHFPRLRSVFSLLWGGREGQLSLLSLARQLGGVSSSPRAPQPEG